VRATDIIHDIHRIYRPPTCTTCTICTVHPAASANLPFSITTMSLGIKETINNGLKIPQFGLGILSARLLQFPTPLTSHLQVRDLAGKTGRGRRWCRERHQGRVQAPRRRKGLQEPARICRGCPQRPRGDRAEARGPLDRETLPVRFVPSETYRGVFERPPSSGTRTTSPSWSPLPSRTRSRSSTPTISTSTSCELFSSRKV
jgi:hypothetical protein